MTEKTLIRYRRRNGSSFAILGNGWQPLTTDSLSKRFGAAKSQRST